MTTKVEVSHRTITFTVFFLLGLYTLFLIRDIVFGLFIAIMLMSALNPLVMRLEKTLVPRFVAIWIVYLGPIIGMAGIIGLLVPPLVKETTNLIQNFPVDQVTSILKGYQFNLSHISAFSSQFNSIPQIFKLITSTFSIIITIMTLLVMTFYLLVERQSLPTYLKWLFADVKEENHAEAFVSKVETQIGGWVRGELTLMIIIGVMTYIGLRILNIPYALPLSILAGTLEILPNLGPTISSIPSIIIGSLTGGPIVGLAVAALYIIVQQLENSLIVPYIMKSAVGINPIITILLLLIGYRLGGVGGAALAIPIFLVIKVVVVEFYRFKKPLH